MHVYVTKLLLNGSTDFDEMFCILVSIETRMLAADSEITALRIGYAKQEFHGPMNSENEGWVLRVSHGNYFIEFLILSTPYLLKT